MKLSVMERILLNGLIPRENNFATLKLIRVAREALSFSDEENKELKFTHDGNLTTWNTEAAEKIGEVEISLGETVTEIIRTELKKLNDANPPKLTEQHFSLYEKFIMADAVAAH